MIKDLVVNLAIGVERDPAAGYAVSIAETFKAHIAGIAFAYDPIVTPTVMDGLSATTWIDSQVEQNHAAAEAAIRNFEKAAAQAGLSAEHRLIEASLGAAAGVFGSIARRFDIAVVGQADPDRNRSDALFIESALLESGRPVAIVPYIHTGGLKLDRVLLCWDAGRNAARAIADAMPFLRRGQVIDVLMVSSRGEEDEVAGADIGAHLARHGLKVEIRRIAPAGLHIADAILSYAADTSADFIVMGGYGHSRMREFVLGGATKGILDAMTVPVLMAH